MYVHMAVSHFEECDDTIARVKKEIGEITKEALANTIKANELRELINELSRFDPANITEGVIREIRCREKILLEKTKQEIIYLLSVEPMTKNQLRVLTQIPGIREDVLATAISELVQERKVVERPFQKLALLKPRVN